MWLWSVTYTYIHDRSEPTKDLKISVRRRLIVVGDCAHHGLPHVHSIHTASVGLCVTRVDRVYAEHIDLDVESCFAFSLYGYLVDRAGTRSNESQIQHKSSSNVKAKQSNEHHHHVTHPNGETQRVCVYVCSRVSASEIQN